MKENTPTYSWSGKIRLTYPPDRCMNKFLPISLFDLLYSRIIPRLCGSLYTIRGSEVGKLAMTAELEADHRRGTCVSSPK